MDNQRLFDLAKKTNEEQYKTGSKKRLMTILEKKFKTTIIGALAQFEERFGDLWGHGKPIEELDEIELEWRNVWIATRTNVLNNGNNQLRASLDELTQYTISWDRYQTNFIIRKD